MQKGAKKYSMRKIIKSSSQPQILVETLKISEIDNSKQDHSSNSLSLQNKNTLTENLPKYSNLSKSLESSPAKLSKIHKPNFSKNREKHLKIKSLSPIPKSSRIPAMSSRPVKSSSNPDLPCIKVESHNPFTLPNDEELLSSQNYFNTQSSIFLSFDKHFGKIRQSKLEVEKLALDFVSFLSGSVLKENDFSDILKEFALKNDQNTLPGLWKCICESDESILPNKAFAVLLAVAGFSPNKLLDSGIIFPPPLNLLELVSSLSPFLEKHIRDNYSDLNIRSSRRSDLNSSTFSFAPLLGEETHILAKKKQNKIGSIFSQKRQDYLLSEKLRLLEKHRKNLAENEEREMKECTFNPNIIRKGSAPKKSVHKTQELYEMAKREKSANVKTSAQVEYEKDMAECTFQPDIKRKRWKEETKGLYSKSVQQQVARLQKAREEEVRKKQMLEVRSPAKSSLEKAFKNSPIRNIKLVNIDSYYEL